MDEYYLLKRGEEDEIAPVGLLPGPGPMRAITSELGWKVFRALAEPACPMDLSRKLGVHEQKVYYYIRKFRKAGLIREMGSEQRHGATARFFRLKASGLAMLAVPGDFRKIRMHSPLGAGSLEPFVMAGELNSVIVVGSPDPHGPWKARASDACCAIDLALFIGASTSGRGVPNYKLDVEMRESDLRKNLILVGGPTVNMITSRINESLPICIRTGPETYIYSNLSGKSYKGDDAGMINLVENPWNPGSRILVMAGKRFPGTRATVLACIRHMDGILKGNRHRPEAKAKVVRGFDMDGDGIIDEAEFLE